MPPLAAGLGCKGVIARKAALVGIHALTALAPRFGRQRRVLRKTPLFVRHTLAALARDPWRRSPASKPTISWKIPLKRSSFLSHKNTVYLDIGNVWQR